MRHIFTICLLFWGVTSVPAQEDAPAPELSKTQQIEIVRRQEQVFSAQKSIKDAAVLEEEGDLAKSRELYLSAVKTLTRSESTSGPYDVAAAGLTRVNLKLAKQKTGEGRLVDALELVQEALNYDSSNTSLTKLRDELALAIKDPRKAVNFFNPAVTSTFRKDIGNAETLFVEAEQFRRTGQYDEAAVRLKKVLSIDPYNKQAFAGLEKISKEKMAYAKVARQQTRESRLAEVSEKWLDPIKRDVFSETESPAPVPITRSNQFKISQKLRSIIIPQIEFADGTTIEDAVNFLNSSSKAADKDGGEGVTFILKPEVLATAKPFSLSLRNVPLGEALRYISQLAGVKPKVEEFAIFIIRLIDTEQAILRRQFNVSPDFFPSTSPTSDSAAGGAATARRLTSSVAVSSSSGNADVKESLMSRGVEFPQGSSAFYIPSSGVLSVINTQDQLDLIEELVNATSTQALMVDVQTKIVEINQEDLNDLSFNLQFNGPNLGGATGNPLLDPALTTPGFQTALRGSQGFSQNSLDSIVRGSGSVNPHLFNVGGFLNQRFFTAVVSALAQKRSTDLLSSPSVRVKSGDEATVKVTRTFFYPTQFDPPELINFTQTSGNSTSTLQTSRLAPPAAIPAFPTEFESADIGVILKIRPQIVSDNRTVDLSLIPEITDFEGFINYGTPITVADRNGVNQVLTNNAINSPVFNRRKVTTKVFIRDGFTVVLGGLVREDYQDVNDKVPILGDLPFIGRAFQSKATKSIKRNLLIFTTARILRPDGEPLNRVDDNAAVAAAAN